MINNKEIAERFFLHFCDIPQKDIAAKFGVQQSVISEWKSGKRHIPIEVLAHVAEEKDVTLDWFLLGKTKDQIIKQYEDDMAAEYEADMRAEMAAEYSGEAQAYYAAEIVEQHHAERKAQSQIKTKNTQASAKTQKPFSSSDPINFVLEAKNIPVVGEAAADESQGQRAGFFPSDSEAYYDEISLPESTAAVKIIGDSMSPVLLDGQLAIIGPEVYNPHNYDIVVAKVEVVDESYAGTDKHWEGVYCKRIVDGGDVWFFLSINSVGVPFTVAKSNCRLWPVIGVYFAGKGKPPEDD